MKILRVRRSMAEENGRDCGRKQRTKCRSEELDRKKHERSLVD